MSMVGWALAMQASRSRKTARAFIIIQDMDRGVEGSSDHRLHRLGSLDGQRLIRLEL